MCIQTIEIRFVYEEIIDSVCRFIVASFSFFPSFPFLPMREKESRKKGRRRRGLGWSIVPDGTPHLAGLL